MTNRSPAPDPTVIAVDAMGGDHAPRTVVEGALLAARENGLRLLLVGRREVLEREIEELESVASDLDRIEIVHAREVVGMGESALAVRRKRDSSVRVCARLVREGRAAAMLTAGNTGAALVAGKMVIGVAPGVDRPALAVTMPRRVGRTILLDAGANVDSKPHQLRQYAVMGHYLAQQLLRMRSPRIGLLSIGEEVGKGTELVREAFKALDATGLNFVGNVEGRDVFSGAADVVVCDGFVGNAILKSAESLAEFIGSQLREEMSRNWRTKFGYLLARPAFESFKSRIDYSEYGGAPMLGLRGGCFVAHGRSSARAIHNAVRRAVEFCEADIHLKVSAKLSEVAYEAHSKAVVAG
ncbi:MAG: phosphate acyltransferase PlsX [Holophagales bacterium]|nr:phosphate acyltransferase PlsX [Holophagales bacterium]MYF95428.1 phosphate acyltransferase PlsX [Holophagales bacterium]